MLHRSRVAWRWSLALLVAASVACLLACGARTPLDVPSAASDASPTTDAGPTTDAPSATDGAPAGADGATHCPDGGPLEIAYALGSDGVIYRYDPLTNDSVALGTPNCANDNVQWTMTGSSTTAYIVYTDWTLWAVDLATMQCTQTPLDMGQLGISGEFGVAIAGSGASEQLYLYGEIVGGEQAIVSCYTASFDLCQTRVLAPQPPVEAYPVNLTADAYGHLYAFSPNGLLQQIDAATGVVLQSLGTEITTDGTWATLTYGSRVFVWVDTNVDEYDLTTQSETSQRDSGISAVGAASYLACP